MSRLLLCVSASGIQSEDSREFLPYWSDSQRWEFGNFGDSSRQARDIIRWLATDSIWISSTVWIFFNFTLRKAATDDGFRPESVLSFHRAAAYTIFSILSLSIIEIIAS